MKRIMLLVVAALLVLTLAGCGGGPPEGAKQQGKAPAAGGGPAVDPSAGDKIRNDVNRDTQNRRTHDAARKSVNNADAAVKGTPRTMEPDNTPVP